MHVKACHKEKNELTKVKDSKKRKSIDTNQSSSSGKKSKNNVVSKKVKKVKY